MLKHKYKAAAVLAGISTICSAMPVMAANDYGTQARKNGVYVITDKNDIEGIREKLNSFGIDFSGGIINGQLFPECNLPGSSNPQKPDTNPGTPDSQKPGVNPETPDNQNPGTSPETPDNQNPGTNPETPDNQNPGTSPETPDNQNPGTNPETPDNQNPGANPEIPDNQNPDTNPDTPEQDTEDTQVHAYVQEVVRLVNQERAKEGLPALEYDASVANAALVRAKETEISFSHTRPNGSSFDTALRESGVSFRGAGENIAWGQKSPQAVMEGWLNSPGHRANIMNKSFTKIGVGYYQNSKGVNYWTQLFTY